jgi:hypothetical protein
MHPERRLEACYHTGNSKNFEKGSEITFHNSEQGFRDILIIKTTMNTLGNKIGEKKGNDNYDSNRSRSIRDDNMQRCFVC